MVNIIDIISIETLLRFYIIPSVSALDDITGSTHSNTDHVRTATEFLEHKFVSFSVGYGVPA